MDSSGITSTSNNGMRIKTYSSVGGVVSTVTYEGICMTGVKTLLDLDPFYSSGNGSHIPDFTNIVVDGAKAVSSASGATSVLEGYSNSDRSASPWRMSASMRLGARQRTPTSARSTPTFRRQVATSASPRPPAAAASLPVVSRSSLACEVSD